jgi:hypothetical protein
MKKLILFTLLPLFSFSQITWSWTDAETGLDKGTFVTNGTLNEDGTVSSGTYTISDFTLDQTSTPISTSGSFANGDWVLSQPDIGFNWSGSYVTEFWRSSGGYTNGLNIYTQGYTHGISMSIDYFTIFQGASNFLVNQSTTPQVTPVNSETDSDIKLNGTVSAESNQIKNVADPTDAQDAATKSYIDNNVNSFSGSYNDLSETPTMYTQSQVDALVTNLQNQIDEPVYTIGHWPELGGYVFMVSDDGKHGLVAETEDQGSESWYNAQNLISNPSNHSVNGQNFRDWRLPTRYELAQMYLQKSAIESAGGDSFGTKTYWTSNQSIYSINGLEEETAWRQNFGSGIQFYSNAIRLTDDLFVRSVREF